MHTFLLLLLGLAMGVAAWNDGAGGRGLVLWASLLATIAVREVARVLVGIWFGMELRGLLLVPTGGVSTYAADSGDTNAGAMRWLAVAGPAANLAFAGVLAALVHTISPGIRLLGQPWITPAYLIRTFLWLNVLMGVVHLLPVAPIGAGRAARGRMARSTGVLGLTGGIAGFGWVLGLAMLVGGLSLGGNAWLVGVGLLLLLGSHFDRSGATPVTEIDTIRMRDIMLMHFSTISASDTLEDALDRSVHTLQDVFPVVRGTALVGAVSRQSLVEALAAGGNSYVQGVMTRSFQTAAPNDAVVTTLRRIVGGRGAQLVPVVEGERVVGIITPQNLTRAMAMLNQRRRIRRPEPAE